MCALTCALLPTWHFQWNKTIWHYNGTNNKCWIKGKRINQFENNKIEYAKCEWEIKIHLPKFIWGNGVFMSLLLLVVVFVEFVDELVCVCASKHPSLCVRTSNHVYVYNIHVLYTLYTMPYHTILYFSIVHSMWPCTSCLSRSCTWNKSTTKKWARKSKPSQFIHTHTLALWMTNDTTWNTKLLSESN